MKPLINLPSTIFKNLFNMATEQHQLNWKPFRADERNGAEIVSLYNARNKNNEGPAAALLRYKPGARVSRHVHLGYELIFVLDGVLHNDAGAHGPGTLEICPPGSTHELWSEKGCVFLVVWEQPVKTKDINEWVEKLIEVQGA